MVNKKLEKQINNIVKRAKEKGFDIHKNNIDKARSVKAICGTTKSRYPLTTEELLCR
jgi:hypothetical protein